MSINRILLTALIITMFAGFACTVLAQTDVSPIWPTYHADNHRLGVNKNSTSIDNPNSMRLIWVYPRADQKGVREDDTIVDAEDVATALGWSSIDNTTAYNGKYFEALSVGKAVPPTAFIEWPVPTVLSKGNYQIYIWLPNSPVDPATGDPTIKFTEKAVYTINYGGGRTETITVDQNENGGDWRLLSNRLFEFDGGGSVTLSNQVEDAGASIKVAADAVKFVSVVPQEIYSSPTSGWIDNYQADIDGDGTQDWNDGIPVVYFGSIEPSLVNATNAPETGSVHCVNSITPTIQRDWRTGVDKDKFERISKLLGTDVWRYPRSASERIAGTKAADGTVIVPPNDIEGPIENGIYSAPVIADALINGIRTPVCIVTASDRQIYAFNAKTGELIWKGPGVTLSEPNAVDSIPSADAFGGRYRQIQCPVDEASASTLTWDFSGSLALANIGGTEGLAYSIYVWIPPQNGSESLKRASDVKYTITYKTVGGDTTRTIVMDQYSPQSQGRWMKLGGSYFNVQKVEMSNWTTTWKFDHDNDPATVEQPGDYGVIADAVMIVPESVGSFSYCTPAVDGNKLLHDNQASPDQILRVFAANSAGRVYCMNIVPADAANKIGRLEWVYPKVRTMLQIADVGKDGDQPDLGGISASPAYYNGKLYVATYNGGEGQVVSIKDIDTNDPKQEWIYPAEGSKGYKPAGFTSSPALFTAIDDYKLLLIGDTGGVFHAVNWIDGTRSWIYPENPGTTEAPGDFPLGAFRYSTPVVAQDKDSSWYIWAGSTDGKVYCFDLNGERQWVEVSTDGTSQVQHGSKWFLEPQLPGAIQGSIAFDGNGAMYIPDMSGRLHWYKSTTGLSDWSKWDPDGTGPKEPSSYTNYRCEGILFSSPNVTNIMVSGTAQASYVYVGGGDGRLYAFSGGTNSAWGGHWSGGDYPFEGDPDDDDERKEDTSAPNTTVQFDVFPADVYSVSETFNPQLLTSGRQQMPNPWDPLCIISDNMKQPTTADRTSLDTLPTGTTAEQQTYNNKLDEILTEMAKKRRNEGGVEVFPSANGRAGSSSSDAIYFEWGETLYLILWNLPGLDYLYGGSGSTQRRNIKFTMQNTSAGASAGSTLKLDAYVDILKEYTVLDNVQKTHNPGGGQPTVNYYEPLKTFNLKTNNKDVEVKRCYALARIKLDGTGSRPPSPGPGWILNCEFRIKDTSASDAPVKSYILPIARLRSASPPELLQAPASKTETGTFTGRFIEQKLGVNNPLAILSDQGATLSVGWPADVATFSCNNERNNAQAHFNGNGTVAGAGDEFQQMTPQIDLEEVNHGTPSRLAQLGLVDRSATGLDMMRSGGVNTSKVLDKFRLDAGDLAWRGGDVAITTSDGTRFPWEYGPGSVDYPNIFKRYHNYRKLYDDKNPAEDRATLPPINIPTGVVVYDQCFMQPDICNISVEVPRFQPANKGISSADRFGYSRLMTAYIDSNGDHKFDRGDIIVGKSTAYQEAYREFKVGLVVPPDPKIEVEEQTIDIGRAPHGLGSAMATFNAYEANPFVQQWFKPITIKNAGNVNFSYLSINRITSLLASQSNPSAPLPSGSITSSLDSNLPPSVGGFAAEPFKASGYGYTLSKPRVGDPDPTILSIPDRRRWDGQYFTPAQQAVIDRLGLDSPLTPKISVRVPLGQPIGTYTAPFVPVIGNLSNNAQAMAEPTFQLNITVRESQLTGGVSKTSLPQIDEDFDSAGALPPRVGDTTPAAYKDAATGDVHLIWSSNRAYGTPDMSSQTSVANAAGAPWFLHFATLDWANAGSVDNFSGFTTSTLTPGRWWSSNPTSKIPYFEWPDILLGSYPQGAAVQTFAAGTTSAKSVNHTSPIISHNLAVGPTAAGATWLAWTGSADIIEASTSTSAKENRVFYTDITGGNIAGGGGVGSPVIHTIDHDPTMAKRSPSMAVDGSRMWMFWQGGESGKWSIFYANNNTGPAFPSSAWSDDMRLRTPDCLASVSSPNALYRKFWTNILGENPDTSNTTTFLDVVYAGNNKIDQTPDVLLTRYAEIDESDVNSAPDARTRKLLEDAMPSKNAQPLPRVYGEQLEKDPKFGFFRSKHLAWIRYGKSSFDLALKLLNDTERRNLLIDRPGRGEHLTFENLLDTLFGSKPAARDLNAFNLPYIWIELPEGYDTNFEAGTAISATDGSVTLPNSSFFAGNEPKPIIPIIDEATGVYTYKYPEGSVAAEIFGETLVDYSAGVVRFTKPIKEVKVAADGSYISPTVWADYTPQTWRFTTDNAVDNSPRAFIERTRMWKVSNPGLGEPWHKSALPAPVDRLWVIWRKAGTGVDTGTIFYTTYRVGVDLVDLMQPAIPVSSDGTVLASAELTISGNKGPWEVDRTGTKVYFSEVDERYRSLVTSGSPIIGPGPGPITITYKVDGDEVTVIAHDVFWQKEMPEQSLLGFTTDGNVNEGSIWAFADPDPKYYSLNAALAGVWNTVPASKIWVFWSSTRAGTSDLFYETVSPNFSGVRK